MRPRESPIQCSVPVFLFDDPKEKGLFSGYASTYCVDLYGDKIEKGAFKSTIQEWESKGRFPHIYWEHDIEDVIGMCLDMREDDKGLFIRGKLLLDIPRAKEVYKSLSCGVRGLSIGFVPTKSFLKKGVRHIQGLCLKEVSLVKRPCNTEAKICEYKAACDDDYVDMIRDLSSTIQGVYGSN